MSYFFNSIACGFSDLQKWEKHDVNFVIFDRGKIVHPCQKPLCGHKNMIFQI